MYLVDISQKAPQLTRSQSFSKRSLDLLLAIVGLLLFWPVICIAWLLSSIDSRGNGFFLQTRVGKEGRQFRVVKIKTMRSDKGLTTTVTRSNDPRVTPLGRFFRRTKIDELPQLWNVLLGEMSFVGPRPDVPGFADQLKGKERAILSIRPGITGPATLKYRNEEEILAAQPDPERFNQEVIYPDKVRLNLEYIRNWTLTGDVRYICQTIFDK